MAITIDGVTYRNLPEQVKQNAEDIEELKRKSNLSYQVVDELPESGEEAIIYLVPMDDGEEPNIYEEYMWINDEWELIGTTAADLTNYVTLDGTQTITGVKTFSNGIKLGTDATATPNSWGTVVYANAVTGLYTFDTILETQTLRPTSSGEYDLGIATRKWRDFYIDGKIYFSHTSVSRGWHMNVDEWGTLNIASNNNGGPYTNYYSIQTGSFLPLTNSDLGSSSANQRWKDIYMSGKIDFGGGGNLALSNGNGYYFDFTYNGTTCFRVQDGSINSNNKDLGTSTYRWKDLYLSNSINLPNSTIYESNDTSLVLSNSNGEVVLDNCVLSDGTNTVSIADLKALIDYAKGQGWIS